MITDTKKWHYLPVKRLFALFKGITSKQKGDFCCLNCFCSYRTENKLKKQNHDNCYVETPNNHEEKSMKVPFIILTLVIIIPKVINN